MLRRIQDRIILEKLMQGWKVKHIAHHVGMHEKSMYRVIKRPEFQEALRIEAEKQDREFIERLGAALLPRFRRIRITSKRTASAQHCNGSNT